MNKRKWEDLMKPQAELTASITNPEVFKQYLKLSENEEVLDSGSGEIKMNENSSFAFSDAKFDPSKGLVDSEGNVLVTKEEFMENSDIDGFASTDLSM